MSIINDSHAKKAVPTDAVIHFAFHCVVPVTDSTKEFQIIPDNGHLISNCKRGTTRAIGDMRVSRSLAGRPLAMSAGGAWSENPQTK